jgi:hypothetical protein
MEERNEKVQYLYIWNDRVTTSWTGACGQYLIDFPAGGYTSTPAVRPARIVSGSATTALATRPGSKVI